MTADGIAEGTVRKALRQLQTFPPQPAARSFIAVCSFWIITVFRIRQP